MCPHEYTCIIISLVFPMFVFIFVINLKTLSISNNKNINNVTVNKMPRFSKHVWRCHERRIFHVCSLYLAFLSSYSCMF